MKVFAQTEAHRGPLLIEVDDQTRLQTIVDAVGQRVAELDTADIFIFLEDRGEVLNADLRMTELEVDGTHRVHLHHCRRINLTVNYQSRSLNHGFPPSTRVETVKQWAARQETFHIDHALVPELTLQLCADPEDRPDEDTHIGSLVTSGGDCTLCLDLSPTHRPQG